MSVAAEKKSKAVKPAVVAEKPKGSFWDRFRLEAPDAAMKTYEKSLKRRVEAEKQMKDGFKQNEAGMCTQGANFAKGAMGQQQGKWQDSEEEFLKAKDAVNKELKEQFVQEEDKHYLAGGKEYLQTLEEELYSRWEKNPKFERMAQDVKKEPIITPPRAERKEPIITIPPVAEVFWGWVEDGAGDVKKPVNLPDPTQKRGVKWLAEKEREEKAKEGSGKKD